MHLGDVICGIPGNPSEEACNQAPMILQERDVLLFSVHHCYRLGPYRRGEPRRLGLPA